MFFLGDGILAKAGVISNNSEMILSKRVMVVNSGVISDLYHKASDNLLDLKIPRPLSMRIQASENFILDSQLFHTILTVEMLTRHSRALTGILTPIFQKLPVFETQSNDYVESWEFRMLGTSSI
jgi:hypothetical protein